MRTENFLTGTEGGRSMLICKYKIDKNRIYYKNSKMVINPNRKGGGIYGKIIFYQ